MSPSGIVSSAVRRLACLLAAALLAGPAAAACTGDCDGDGRVRINELVAAVGIALGQSPIGACAAVDADGDRQVTIAELIAATNALLSGCPPDPSPSPTAPPTESPSPSPTATANQPPALPPPFVYRGYVGQPIALPLRAVDPEGGNVTCAGAPLLAGMSLGPDDVLRWTPAADQLGPLEVPLRCEDDGQPPALAAGTAAFRIAPADPCVTPACAPAAGCSGTVAPVGRSCCDGTELPRLPEAEVFCPAGRLLLIGRNTVGFGALGSCDHLRFRQRAQASAELRFHIRVSCVNPLNPVSVRAKLESATRGILVDARSTRIFLPPDPTDGFYERRNISFPFTQDGPFLDIEESEANLTVTVEDSDGAEVSETVRVILTSDPTLPDLPDP